jgi:hypothetical protein
MYTYKANMNGVNNMSMSREELIADYEAELQNAIDIRDDGETAVADGTAGSELARGRDYVPIEEYITYWQMGLKALQTGANVEDWNY